MNTEIQKGKLRKIIDIEKKIILPELEKLAKKENRDLKNFIETQLIALVDAAKTKK